MDDGAEICRRHGEDLSDAWAGGNRTIWDWLHRGTIAPEPVVKSPGTPVEEVEAWIA